MLQYRNKLLQASFRGVNFHVREINATMGRRTVTHQYLGRDEPYVEDLGRRAREFAVTAYVMNPNDYSQVQALQAALENNSEPGTFVHPSMGQMLVRVSDFTKSFSNQEGGITYFNITFIETLGNNFPTISVDTQARIRLSVDNFVTSSNAHFASKFITSGLPDFIATSARNNLTSFVNKFRGIVNFASAANNNNANYSKLIARINEFEDDIPALIANPSQLAQTINDLNKDLNAMFADNPDLAQIMQGRLYEYGDDFLLIVGSTYFREIEGENQRQLVFLIKASSIAMMVLTLSLTTFDSSDDAIAARDSIDKRAWVLLEQVADNFDDELYKALTDTITAMVQDVKVRSADLSQVRTYSIADCLPAKVLAYEYTEDAEQEAALVARNKIVNPLFVPANSTIKVVN